MFEDGFITLPRDASLEDDHRAVEFVDGIPMVPRIERKDLKDAELVRHGDGAIAGALMNFAALNHTGGGAFEYHRVQLDAAFPRAIQRGAGWRTQKGIW
ncbi:hypothetical protein D9M69_719670 [compost metagenome]